MQRFFTKALVFLLSLAVILNLLGSLARTTAPIDDWQQDLRQRYNSLKSADHPLEAVTLGNSHSDAIDYAILGMNGQSLAVPAADLFEVEQYIYLLDHTTPDLQIVFITISYYSFARDNRVFDSLRPRRIGFYSNLPVWSPIQNDAGNFLLGKLDGLIHVTSVTRSDSWEGVWTELANPMPDPMSFDGIRTTSEWGVCDHYSAEMLDSHAHEIALKNVQSTQQMLYAHENLEQDSFQALSRSIEHLQERGVRVILFTPAYYEKYNQYFSENDPTIITRMQDAVATLQKMYQLEYYDFSLDRELTHYPELFVNSDHLGLCGRKVLSEHLQQLIFDQAPVTQ